jgi:glycosyltransferase involved in cell wall biosynthesis
MMHRSADAVTVISRVLQERAARLGRPEAMLIPNGVRYEQIRAAAHRHPKIPGRILFVGRLENMKGVDTLLRAFAALVPRPRKSVPIMHLHIVGSGSKRAMLEKLSHKLHLDEWVSFQGRLDGEQLLQEYAEAEIFCGLSRSEALGNVFLEAEAAGCAVVATNVGGIPDIVENGRTGLLVAAGDPAGAAEALESLLRDPMLRKKLMAEGIERMKKYDWKILAQRYEEVYEKLIG